MRSTYIIPTTVSWFTSTVDWLSLANEAWGQDICLRDVQAWRVPLSRFHTKPPEMRPNALNLSPTTVFWFTSTAGWLSLANDAWDWDTMVEGVPIVHWSYSSHAKAHVLLLTLPKPVHIISDNNYSKNSVSCLRNLPLTTKFTIEILLRWNYH
jgi:hypothetical protein